MTVTVDDEEYLLIDLYRSMNAAGKNHASSWLKTFGQLPRFQDSNIQFALTGQNYKKIIADKGKDNGKG